MVRLLFITMATLCGVGCAVLAINDPTLIDRLAGRGPVALSTDNPYIAANLLLAREMEQSAELRGFLEKKGAPPAIEVRRDFFAPPQLELFYPMTHQRYVLEPLGTTWLIPSPQPLEGEKLQQITVLTKNLKGRPALLPVSPLPPPATPLPAPVVHTAERAEREQKSESLNDAGSPFQSPRITPTPNLKTPTPRTVAPRTTPKPARPREEAAAPVTPLSTTPAQSPPTPPPLAQETLHDVRERAAPQPKLPPLQDSPEAARIRSLAAKASGTAELSPQGDIVHYVSGAGESLLDVARWYTFDPENAPRLARINRIADPSSLAQGDQIIIPSYMVKNTARLDDGAVQALHHGQ